jgi:hypothetical protein
MTACGRRQPVYPKGPLVPDPDEVRDDIRRAEETGRAKVLAELLAELRELDNLACEVQDEQPAYANATWDAIHRIQRAAGMDLWPE